MGRTVYDNQHKRDVGDNVPGYCDYPHCKEIIERSIARVCGSAPFGGSWGCGLFFCDDHITPLDDDSVISLCERCAHNLNNPGDPLPEYEPSADLAPWINFKLHHSSFAKWRKKHPTEVQRLEAELASSESRQ